MADGAGGTKVDEVYADFRLRFDKAEQDAARIGQSLQGLGKAAGVAADAQQRLETQTQKVSRAQEILRQRASQIPNIFSAIATEVRQTQADMKAGPLTTEQYRARLAQLRAEAIELRRSGLNPAGRELTAFHRILGATVPVVEETKKAVATATVATGRFTRAANSTRAGLTTLLATAAGVPGPIGRIASALLVFGIGTGLTAGVLASLYAIGAAWRALTRDSREAREAMQKAREEAQRLFAGQQPGLATQRTREGVEAALRAADERLARARRGRLVTGPVTGDVTGAPERVIDQRELNAALIERNHIVRELAAVTRVQAEQAEKEAETRQQAIAAEIQGLTQLQQLQAIEATDLERARRLHDEIVTLLAQEDTIIGRAQLEALANALAGPAGLLQTGRTRQELAAAMETARQLRATVVDINTQLGLRGVDVRGRPFGSALTEFEGQLGDIRSARRGALGLGDGRGAFSADEELRAQRALLQLDRERADQVQALAAAEADLAATLAEIRTLEEQIAQTTDDATRLELTNQLRQAFGKLYQSTVRVSNAMRGLGATSRSAFLETVQGAAIALRALNRVGDAAGFLDEDLRRSVDSALDLLQVIEQLQSAKSLSSGQALALGGGLLSAGVGLAIGIGNALFGESEREKLLRENTEQLARLANSAEALRTVFGRVTGNQLTQTLQAIERARQERRFNPTQFDRGDVSAEDLRLIEDAAEAFGITVDDSIASLDQLRQAINEVDFQRLAESFAGAMDLMRREFDLFDIDDPIAKVERLRQHLLEFADIPEPFRRLIEQADLTTAEGRAQLESLVQTLFRLIQAGILDASVLGDLTLDEFLNLLGDIESTLDDAAASAEGEADNFTRSSRITEVQGAVIVAILDTMNFRAAQQVRLGEQSVSELERIRAILDRSAPLPPTPPGSGTREGDGTPSTQISVQLGGITVHGGGDPQAVGAAVADHVATAIDERLRELQLRKQRAGGA